MEEFSLVIADIVSKTQHNIPLIFILLAVMWGMFVLTRLSGNRLLILGIMPRHPFGLLGIIFSPFLHGNFNHIFFNSIPFFILSDFILISGLDIFVNISFYVVLISGILTWCFGRKAIHIGASSLITGYWSFLVINIYSHGGIMAIILGLISIYYFAGIFFGIFPTQKGVSWEGHLFGLIAGIIVNYSLFYLPNIMAWF